MASIRQPTPFDSFSGGFAAPDVLGVPGTCTLTELDPPTGHHAEDTSFYLTKAPIVVAGYGGWSRVARPRKKAITEWVGRDSMSLQMEILFDAFAEDQIENRGLFIEDQIRTLERFGGIDEDDPPPPLIQIESVPERLVPHNKVRAGHVRWFVDTLVWDADSVIVHDKGNRLRAAGTLTITQFVEDVRVQRISAVKKRRRSRSKKGAHLKTYVVRAGDTLSKIAARKDVYGDASKWKPIAKANKIRDPKNLKRGQELKIP